MPPKPRDLTETELDALSVVSASDKEAAAAAWRVDTAPQGSRALDATEYLGDA